MPRPAALLAEAWHAASVEHDHVVSIYQVGEDRDVPFLAMPPAANPRRAAERERRLPLPEVLRIGREAADGPAAAHEAGLIHRDVKPSNIWLESTRNLLESLDSESQTPRLWTFAGGCRGCPPHAVGFPRRNAGLMAPEQTGGRPVDHRCDLFGLGCVLYRMYRRSPFSGPDTLATLTALQCRTLAAAFAQSESPGFPT
jgi:serine/threonine protein kinase